MREEIDVKDWVGRGGATAALGWEGWRNGVLDQLPDYMQVCYLAVYNIINEVAYDVLKDEGYIIIKYLRKSIEMERGDLRKAVQCYMNETGASDKDAQEYIWSLVREAWKKINGESVANSPFSQAFITSLVNAGRMTHYTYKYGDGHGVQPSNVKDEIKDLLFHHIV
ncbi:hypothetical protein BUALT_Bualt13G0036900 [Buddleja alternifolia]|uniref:Terpene synthase metal-binding domain-containing protein n=1 Tax=Buddleja alternifolia TaxID=168488 RepID=A0AAV6WT07_9LAMI|nr:hypothetical protein BUALT_Bualt13G0036900 [Buddleja alternifolia]